MCEGEMRGEGGRRGKLHKTAFEFKERERERERGGQLVSSTHLNWSV